ncbi:MAG: hypothetical protein LHW56_05945 [Candidatus Cloacimonetes bacterium]|jgi:hypothetical protein|nr:hypothetical protein [Candidatus Cloacimonadota bacterium]MDY0172433.1 hypothetical protein [Candidatus Cloacimonadaceae bacterium]
MFELLGTRIMAGVVALSMLLFSSFQGNDPQLGAIKHYSSSSTLYLSGELLSAFNNDFASIFASSAPIPVYFKLNIKSGNRTVVSQQLTHLVNFNPATGIYVLRKDGESEVLRTSSVTQTIKEISKYKFSVPYQSSWGLISINIQAEMPLVRLEEKGKELDLMVLWKYKKPSAKIQIDLRKAQ